MGVCPCPYTHPSVPCGHQRVTEHRDQSCWTRWGQGTEHSPCRSSCAGGPVPPWLGLCLHPLQDALCISTHHPAPRCSHPPSYPNPSARFPGARCCGGGCWPHPPSPGLRPVSLFHEICPSCCNGVAGTRGLDAVSPAASNLGGGQGGEDRTGSSSCWSTLG